MKILSSLLFPPLCVHCERSLRSQSSWLCPLCREMLHHNTKPLCLHCHTFPCKCSSPHVLWAPFFYEEPIRSLIHAYKYRGYENIGTYLISLFLSSLSSFPFFISSSASLLPVPPFFTRRLTRDYDHTRLLALSLSQRLSLPLSEAIRTRHTIPQSSLIQTHEKQENVSCVFSIQKSLPSTVIIVDDVITSGSTVCELEKEVRLHGASFIYTYAIALAPDLRESVQQEK